MRKTEVILTDKLEVLGNARDDETSPEMIDVALASLHGEIDRQPEEHYYYDSRATRTVVNDDLPKLWR